MGTAWFSGPFPLPILNGWTIAFSMNPGEISPVFQTQYGYHIVRVTANNPKRQPTVEEASEKISATLLHQKKNDLVERWVEDRKKTAEISIAD